MFSPPKDRKSPLTPSNRLKCNFDKANHRNEVRMSEPVYEVDKVNRRNEERMSEPVYGVEF